MLYLVPTPIGNLSDITLRALEILKQADVIVCEDTRHTGLLLKHYQIGRGGVSPPNKGEVTSRLLLSFHEHSGAKRVEEIIKFLEEGKLIALVSDGGMPLISDPGFPVVREAIRRGIQVTALPGPSAAVTALALSGLPAESYSFFGFLPQKLQARKNFFTKLKDREETLIFYESPHRLLITLEAMKEIFGDREAVIVRELTKKFEEISRGHLSGLFQKFSKGKIFGEIVLLVTGEGRKEVFQ